MMEEDGSEISLQNELEEPLSSPLLSEELQKISVVAPANMEAGYTFEASVDGRMFVVTVPDGGVLVGEIIVVDYPKEEDFLDYPINPHRIPNYFWRDGLFDCTAHGKCHPTVFCGFICPPLLSAQVMTRYWNVDKQVEEEKNQTPEVATSGSSLKRYDVLLWWRNISPFRQMEILVYSVGFIFIILKITFLVVKIKAYLSLPDESELQRSNHFYRLIIDAFLSVEGMFRTMDPLTTMIFFIQFFAIVFVISTAARLRHKTRLRYQIAPTTKCDNVCDDIILSTACLCCTVTQIARHTANYNLYEASLDTETGLTPDSPPITTKNTPTLTIKPLPDEESNNEFTQDRA